MKKNKNFIKKLFDNIINIYNNQTFKLLFFTFVFIFFIINILLLIEKEKNPNINSHFDALWYTFVTLTTVGYGDITPLTPIGRVIGIIIMGYGVIVFGTVTGNIASFLLNIRQSKVRGLMKLDKLRNHFIVFGWKEDYEKIVEGIIEANKLYENKIVLVNTKPPEYMETFFANPKFKNIKYINGDYVEESTLLRANVPEADRVLILADFSNNSSKMEIDSRTILTVLNIEKLNKTCYKAAEILDSKFENYLKIAHCDEIILTKEYEYKLLVNASNGTGLSHVISDLLSFDNFVGLNILEIPKNYINNKYEELFNYYYYQKNSVLIGLLENTGNFYQRKKEALNEAQKNANIKKILEELKNVKTLESNKSVLVPDRNYIIKEHSKAIVIANINNLK